LLVSNDPLLLDELLRLAAAVPVELAVMPEPGAAHEAWRCAPLVLLGTEVAAEAVRRGLPRRAGVILVGRDLDDASVWERASSVGAEQVVFLPDAEGWLTGRLATCAGIAPEAPVVCVVGGRGGAGASTLATALASVAVRRGHRCMLIDADPLGGGLDLVLGEESAPGARWPDVVGAAGTMPAGGLRDAVPRCGRGGALSLLSWDRGDLLQIPPESMQVALAAGRGGDDLVVVDLPRRLDPAAQTALDCLGPVLLVVPAEVRATAAAARVATGLRGRDVRVVVRGPAPSGLGPELIAASLGLPLAGFVRADRRLAAALERGNPPGATGRTPWAAFSEGFLDGLPLRPPDWGPR